MQMRSWLNRILVFVLVTAVLMQTTPTIVSAETGIAAETGVQTGLEESQEVGGKSAPENQETSREIPSETPSEETEVTEESSSEEIEVTEESPSEETEVTEESSSEEIEVTEESSSEETEVTEESSSEEIEVTEESSSEEIGVTEESPSEEAEILPVGPLSEAVGAPMVWAAMPFATEATLMSADAFLQAVTDAGIADYEAVNDGGVLTSLTLPNNETEAGKLLILLSHTDPAVYQNATITIVSNVNLVQEVGGLTFAGLGRAQAPYSGLLQANAGVAPAVTLNYSLFEAISQDASNSANGVPIELYFNYEYDEIPGYVPLFARQVCEGTSGDLQEWNLHVNNTGRIYGLIDEIEGAQGIKINFSLHVSDTPDFTGTELEVQPSDGSEAGLICSTLKAGAKLVAGDIAVVAPDANSAAASAVINGFTVSATGSNNAGGLVGCAEDGAVVELAAGLHMEQCVLNTANPIGMTVQSDGGAAGGVVGIMKQGAELILPENQSLSGIWSVTSTTGAAGGVIGSAQGATIDIYELYSGTPIVTISAVNGDAGVLAGTLGVSETGEGCSLSLHQGWKVPEGSRYDVYGKNVGELAGQGADIRLNMESGNKISVGVPVYLKTMAAEGSGGGIIGSYALSADVIGKLGGNITPDAYAVKEFAIRDIEGQKTMYCGGIFGTLVLRDGASIAISEMEITNHVADIGLRQNNYKSITGGLFGRVYDDGTYADKATRALSAIVVQNIDMNLELFDGNEHSQMLGGLIGVLGDVTRGNGIYLEVSDANIYIPHAHAGDNGFGGVIAAVGWNSVVNLENITVSNKLEGAFWHGPDGAGLIGTVAEGTAVRLSGTIDLSDLYYFHKEDVGKEKSSSTGQLIGKQESALIYADENMTLIRGEFISAKYKLDKTGKRTLSDIGNYGSVIRKSDFITIDADTHRIHINNPLTYTNPLVLTSAEDFIKVAISMQSHGHFAGIDGVSKDNCLGLFTTDISLGADIDLTGTGVYSLTRDCQDAVSVNGARTVLSYKGNFQGLNGVKTLTLATGEKWGKYKLNGGEAVDCATLDMDGMGQIYSTNVRGVMSNSHNRVGVLGEVGRRAGKTLTFKDIRLTGTMDFGSNMKGTDNSNPAEYREDVYAGGLIAYADGQTTPYVFENITNELTMTFKNDSFTTVSPDLSRVGGLVGGIDNVDTLEIKKYTGKVNMNYTASNDYVKLGGVIAEIHWTDNAIVVADSVLSNNIQYNTAEGASAAWAMNGGGLFGFVYGGQTYTLTLKGVQVKGQVIEANVAGGNCGGFLGYSWQNANVLFTGEGTDLGVGLLMEASDAGNPGILRVASTEADWINLGGLCYEASGHWRVEENGISMQDVTVQNAYGTLGFILNHGYIGDQAVYLELTDVNSYTIDGSTVEIIKSENKNVDEIIYDGNAGNQNRGAIISIATEEGKLIDLPDSAERNTYINQTKFGGTEEWNTVGARSRYYYNLHLYREEEANLSGELDTPERLLLWSVNTYAKDNLRNRQFFRKTGEMQCTINGEIDLTGYSYYPVRAEGNVIIKPGTTLVLNNKAIEDKEGLTAPALRRSTWETSQHYRMHFGLFREITGSLYVGEKDSASPVTIKGNVGGEKNYSGFLVTSAFGNGVKDAKKQLNLYNVVLEDAYINGYDGSSACPLLINSVGNYADVNIKTLYTRSADDGTGQYAATNTDDGWFAASALMGNFGSSNGVEIAINIEDIRLDGRTAKGEKIEAYDTYRSIFSKATLLQAFAYADQSSYGTYNFIKAEDWTDEGTALHHVTYGKEISESVRNEDLQYQYYGEPYAVDATTADNTDVENAHRFATGYLPYVAAGESGTNHEIDVNLKIYHLLEGCGTYGHPYSIKEAGEIQTVADYLGTGLAKKGWIICYNAGRDFCQGNPDYDKFYKYDGETWTACDIQGALTEGGTLTDEEVLEYLSAAYYSQDADITMFKKFSGLGTEDRPFHGVFVNNSKGAEDGKKYNLTITTEGGQQMTGLVSVSDGCVVKDIQIHFAPVKKNIEIKNIFGGVIAKVLRGDSVIDGVDVTYADGIVVNQYYQSTGVVIGGLVGQVQAGGVTLRNITCAGVRQGSGGELGVGPALANDRTAVDNYAYLYANPYIGRVINGYVISQNCLVDNGKMAHYIAEFVPKATKEATLGTPIDNVYPVEISGADGLYAFSLIMGCGPASSHADVGYVESFRGRGEADYSMVGKPDLTADHTDYLASLEDDAENGSSYIIRCFTNGAPAVWKTLNSQQISVAFTADCDMSGFGGSFRGIGYRSDYSKQDNCKVTLAGTDALTGVKNDGTIAQITYVTESKEHEERTIKQVGLFNRVYTAENAVLHDVNICGSLLMDIYNSYGQRNNSTNDENLAGGGLVGVLNAGAGTKLQNIMVGNGQANSFVIGKADTDIDAPRGVALNSVGGVIGLAMQNSVTLQDCVIRNSYIAAPYTAGGLIGIGAANISWNNLGLYLTYTKDTVMENVIITTVLDCGPSSAVGGLVGLVHSGASVGTSEGTMLTLNNFNLSRNAASGSDNVSVGGVLGYVETTNGEGITTIDNVMIKNSYLGDGLAVEFQENLKSEVYYGKSRSAVGGMIGVVQGRNTNLTNCHFKSGTIVAGKDAGGLLGWVNGQSLICNVQDCSVASGTDNKVYLWGHDTAGGVIGTANAYKGECHINNFRAGVDGGALLSYVKYTQQGEKLKVNRTAGGVLGLNNVSKFVIADTELENMTVVAPQAAGGIVGYVSNVGNRMEISGVAVENSRIVNTGIGNADMTISAAGVCGGSNSATKNLLGANVWLDGNAVWHLVDDTTADNSWITWQEADMSTKSEQSNAALHLGMGNVAGAVSDSSNIYFVGISIQNATIQGKEEPLQDVGTESDKGYLVFADYTGTCGKRTVESWPGVPPFVNFSPYDENFLMVYEDATDVTGTQLYGDGVAFVENADTGKQSIAQLIYQEGVVPELKAGITEDRMTFYNAAENTTGVDFPVFLMEEKKQSQVDRLIKAYMDLLTGGGASDYLAVADCQVAINTYQKQGNKFVNIRDASLGYDADAKTFHTIAGKNDSGYNQFTLIAVKFKDPTKGNFTEGNPYTLYIPIIVKLPVEISFHAAAVHDTVFLDEVMEQASSQVVAEYGSRATVRFAYTYSYNWGSVLESVGANPAESNPLENSFKKSVNLYTRAATESTVMPAGTRLTLVDPQRKDRSYSTTLTENKSVLDLEALFEDWDSVGLRSVLQTEKVSGTPSEDEQLWVEVVPESEEAKEGLLSFDEKYYRTATAEDTGDLYRFVCKEEYFLVMQFPEEGTNICNMEFTVQDSLDGQYTDRPSLPNIVTDISDEAARKLFVYQAISHQVTKVSESLVRYINDNELPAENVEGGFVALEATKNKVVLELKDTIQGTPDYVNLLGAGDKRFLQFSISLDEYITETMEDVRMKPDVLVDAVFTQADGSPLASYSMVVSGETHELILPVAASGDGSNPVNLVDYLKEKKGNAEIYATIGMTFFPESSLENFPVAKVVDNRPESYVRFSITSLLSEKESFLSGARAKLDAGMAGYYRASAAYAKLNFEADRLSELGINIKSPEEADLPETRVTGGGYIDASGIQDYLGGDMVCTLRLYQKQNDGSYLLVNMEDYLNQVSLNGRTQVAYGESMSWSFAAVNNYDGCYDPATENFVIPAAVTVKHDIPEDGVYANYRLELTVAYADAGGMIILTLNPDYFVYTFAKISTNLLR